MQKRSLNKKTLPAPASLAVSGLVAAAYAVLTILFAPISYGHIQVRISEALTVLPFLFPQAVPGLFIGCLIANFAGGFGILDVVLGSGATLLAAVLTARMPNAVLAAVPPVVVNMVVVGGYLSFLLDIPFLPCALYVGLGQVVACCFLGIPLVLLLEGRMKKGGTGPAQ
ncbi:QueT transporter family protein [Aminivibrio sp.]|jgi:uncharacterized membrane protein|uniref:QueT transporter family protein n=1 Tax=Aminivibrio sp. TaxID=1872489 RepID=UPI001A566B1F|nr:QueT transporter family protein [Aminivibrio sp.]MBL3539280.1 QueT transporter family protein [Aminivibrio sp.]MDK2958255.1 hypothetical protein [Synergistaceae bacterium]